MEASAPYSTLFYSVNSYNFDLLCPEVLEFNENSQNGALCADPDTSDSNTEAQYARLKSEYNCVYQTPGSEHETHKT